MTVLGKTSFGRVWKTVKDEGKISQAVLDLKVLQNMSWKLWTFSNCFLVKN
jgi:hypothetical protein